MVRVSGPATADIATRCFTPHTRNTLNSVSLPTAIPGEFAIQLHGPARQRVPCDLFYWPTSRSYTREPVAEFHTLGSPPILRATLEAACHAGARLAEPGEFTLRAFLAGRLDLTQAEAVLGVIDAQRPDQLHAAIEQLAGNLGRPLVQLREDLLMLLAELEAGLDFVEEDIEFISAAELTARLESAVDEVRAVSEQMSSRLAATDTCQVVLFGVPNAGKSSLFNALAERFGAVSRAGASAIVSSQRGTTRDYLTATIELGDIRCELVDTAGIEDDPTIDIAASAQELTREQLERAVLRAYCVEVAHLAECVVPPAELVVVTKCDLAPNAEQIGLRNIPPTILTSSVTSVGLDELGEAIAALRSTAAAHQRSRCVAATADRCSDSLRLADAALTRAAEISADGAGDELVAADVRVALAELGRVVGVVYTDDILDRIFKSFCIGK